MSQPNPDARPGRESPGRRRIHTTKEGEGMAVGAIDYNRSTDAGALVADAARSLREAREKVLRAHAVLDQMRDSGAIGAFFQQKTGTDAAEGGKLFDELSSLKGYVESTGADTLGAAVLQACAKFGV